MNGIVWEPEWRYSGVPIVGDYIQVKCWCGEIDEGFVVSVESMLGSILVELSGDDFCQHRYMVCWRKGALPEFSTIGLRRSVDA